jgi:hypothetical protein
MTKRLSRVEFHDSNLNKLLREMKSQGLTIASRTPKKSREYILRFCNRMHIPPHLRAVDLAMENILNAVDSLKVECEDLSLIEPEFGKGLADLEEFSSFFVSKTALLS